MSISCRGERLKRTHRVDDVANFKIFGGNEDLLRGLIALGFTGVDGDIHALGREVIVITYRGTPPPVPLAYAFQYSNQKLTFHTGRDLAEENMEGGKSQYIRNESTAKHRQNKTQGVACSVMIRFCAINTRVQVVGHSWRRLAPRIRKLVPFL